MKRQIKNLFMIILFDTYLFFFLLLGFHALLGAFGLQFRQWVYIFWEAATALGTLAGIIQLILKIKRDWLKTSVFILFTLLFLVSLPYTMLFAALSVKEERVVFRDGKQYVAEVSSWHHASVSYYEYKNFIVQGKEEKIYETYRTNSPFAEDQNGNLPEPETRTYSDNRES